MVTETQIRLRKFLSHCTVCGKPIVRMRRRRYGPGMKFVRYEFSKASYCSNACSQAAYRRRRVVRLISQYLTY